MMKRVLLTLTFSLFFFSSVSALGISPAIYEIDYKPGEIVEINYKVSPDYEYDKIKVFVEGNLAHIVELDKNELKNGEGFKATITFPKDIASPGLNKILIGVEGIPKEGSALGTSVKISGVVKIFVSYPGKYLEGYLNVPDSNVGENVQFELYVINRGQEVIDLVSRVDFFESDRLMNSVNLQTVSLDSGEEKTFKSFLDTTGYVSGDYYALANLNYGEESYFNDSFRVGSLYVKVVNFSEELRKKGIEKFYISIESNWNGILNEVFADVNLSKSGQSFSFRTPSVDLNPWEVKSLTGFVDTTELSGEYDAEISLFYGEEFTVVRGKVSINPINFTVIIGVVTLIIILAVFVIFILWKKRRKLKNKNISKRKIK